MSDTGPREYTASLTTLQKRRGSLICKLVELKMLDFSDRTRTCISILTSAADIVKPFDPKLITYLITDASRLNVLGFALI